MDFCIRSHIEEADGFARHLGLVVEHYEPDFARVSFEVDERHTNGVGLIHGGALFAAADLAFAAASNACQGGAMLNVSSSITYLKASKKGPVVAEARAERTGRHLGTYNIRLTDGDGELIAVCRVTGFRTELPIR